MSLSMVLSPGLDMICTVAGKTDMSMWSILQFSCGCREFLNWFAIVFLVSTLQLNVASI